jgi:hypothetical protein
VISPNGSGQSPQNANKPHHYPDLVDSFTWPDGATVWALFLTLIVIAWQSTETRDAAKAARDSIRMQELSLRQWVELSNWRNEFIPSTTDRPALMRFKVDIVNSTNFPLTIHHGHLIFGGNAKFFLADECFMTPNVPYTIDLCLHLSSEQEQGFLRNGFWFSVRGGMPHIGVLGRLFPQPICGHLNCVNGIPAVWQPEMPTEGDS